LRIWFLCTLVMEKSRLKYNIPNVKKTLDVLEILARNPRGLTLAETIEKSGFTKTTVFRVLCTLENLGYVVKRAEDRKYSISRKLVALAYASLSELNLTEVSLDVMRNVRDTIKETTMLGTLADGECIMIEQVLGSHSFNFCGKAGMKSPLHASAPGKAFLAFLPDAECARLIDSFGLKSYTPSTITSKSALFKEIAKIRSLGFSTDSAEVISGVNCVGAPIFNSDGAITAVLWATGPAERFRAEDAQNQGAYLRSMADIISRRLGHIF